jgi:transcriptional regulator with XRE-family HTH domain
VGWRERLREAVGSVRAEAQHDAAIAPETLSKILNGHTRTPGFETIARIASAAGVQVGWILEEAGYAVSPHQIGEMLELIALLQNAIQKAETAELVRLRAFLEEGAPDAVRPTARRDAQAAHAWRTMIRRVRRNDYGERVAALLPLLRVFRGGRLEVGGSGGASAMVFVRTPDGKQFYAAGAHAEVATAVAAAVNLVLDLTAAEPRE